jgi:hypothetical protein
MRSRPVSAACGRSSVLAGGYAHQQAVKFGREDNLAAQAAAGFGWAGAGIAVLAKLGDKVAESAALCCTQASYSADLAFARQALKRASGYLLGSAINCPGFCGAVKAMGAVPNPGCLLHFPEDMAIADSIAWVAGRQARSTQRHRFPDGELWWKLPEALPLCMAVWRTPNDPHKKLVELLLVAWATRARYWQPVPSRSMWR